MSRVFPAEMTRRHLPRSDRKARLRTGFVQDHCIEFHDREGNNHQHLIEVYLW